MAEVEACSVSGGKAVVPACMSSTVTREQFDRLLAKVESQAVELAALRERVAALERGREAEFEVVSSVPAAVQSSSSAPLVLSSSGISEERREVARGIGRWLKRCVEGEARGPSGSDRVNLPSKLYIICRDINCNVYKPPIDLFYLD